MTDVPNLPGVPALPSFSAIDVVLLVEDLVSFLFGITTAPQWGIFLDGVPVIVADNTISFEYRQDFPVSDYPVEGGGFQSYDKVQLPGDIRMQFSAGGSIANRQAFLESIENEINTTDLYDVLTPEQVYLSYNFTHRDIRKRTAQDGAGLIVVDLWLTEIRESTTATFTNTQQPGDAGKQNTGNVQAQTPTNDFSSRFNGQPVQ